MYIYTFMASGSFILIYSLKYKIFIPELMIFQIFVTLVTVYYLLLDILEYSTDI